MIKKYRKKPVEIEAIQYMGTIMIKQVEDFIDQQVLLYEDGGIGIPTLEGVMKANVGDFIIKGVVGEAYPCKPEIFKATYDEV